MYGQFSRFVGRISLRRIIRIAFVFQILIPVSFLGWMFFRTSRESVEALSMRLGSEVAARIAERTRDDWAAVFAGSDACAVPVLTLAEAPEHPHNAARATYLTRDGVTQPAPAPRLSRTPGQIAAGSQSEPLEIGALLARWGG